MRVGDPSLDTTEMGPLIAAATTRACRAYVDDSHVVFRGTAPDGPGFWFPPTVVLPGVADDRAHAGGDRSGRSSRCCRSTDEADAIRLANDTPYGLSGSIWTNDLGRALRVSRGIESGNLSVNSHSSVRYWTPFGGFKKSGLGRELGPDALDGVHRGQERLHLDGRLTPSWTGTTDRVVVITGGGSGIGKATALRVASEGAKVVVVDMNLDSAGAVAEEVDGLAVQADVTDAGDVARMFGPRTRRTARSTSRSTTPASRRPTTTRSSTRASRRGTACRR